MLTVRQAEKTKSSSYVLSGFLPTSLMCQKPGQQGIHTNTMPWLLASSSLVLRNDFDKSAILARLAFLMKSAKC